MVGQLCWGQIFKMKPPETNPAGEVRLIGP